MMRHVQFILLSGAVLVLGLIVIWLGIHGAWWTRDLCLNSVSGVACKILSNAIVGGVIAVDFLICVLAIKRIQARLGLS